MIFKFHGIIPSPVQLLYIPTLQPIPCAPRCDHSSSLRINNVQPRRKARSHLLKKERKAKANPLPTPPPSTCSSPGLCQAFDVHCLLGAEPALLLTLLPSPSDPFPVLLHQPHQHPSSTVSTRLSAFNYPVLMTSAQFTPCHPQRFVRS